jgi:hypothetical protein
LFAASDNLACYPGLCWIRIQKRISLVALVAIIRRYPKISIAEWLQITVENKLFEVPPTRTVPNPFKPGQLMVVARKEGEVMIARTGAIVPSDEFDDDGELEIWATDDTHDEMKQVAAEVAQKLKAELDWLP